jgi:rare lipoprotein A
MALAIAALLLVGCASTPPPPSVRSDVGVVARPGPAPSAERDGPEAQPPPDLASIPDAEPRIEPIRSGGPNKPYEALGRTYVPITADRPFVEHGLASWYGRKFQGRRTSSGELYNMYEMTAAHPTLPIPSYARVSNPANGREVVVRINDRGPFHAGRVVDLSYTAALKLDLLRGVGLVEVERITHNDIRSGAWRRGAQETQVAMSAPAVAAPRIEPTLPASKNASAAKPTAAWVEPPPSAAPMPRGEVAGDSSVAPTATQGVPPQRAFTKAASGYWVQLGAFRDRGGAEAFQRRIATELEWLGPLMAIFNETTLHRLQAGPYASRAEAGHTSQRIREALELVPVIVERR